MDEATRTSLSASFAPGRLLQERYLLEHELGRGGMGQVFLARDARLDRPVAIKVIARPGVQNDPANDRELKRAFAEEARLGANLNHAAIATVFDYGFHEGKPFTVFEYIGGETLEEVIRRRKRIAIEDTQLIVAGLAQALDFAHAHHIVHRDLKPANIRATPQGQFKILDLGLAKQIRQDDNWRGFAGTPSYASPEQAAMLPVDGRTDQYALALIAYEMLTGRRPFLERDPMKLLELHREAEVPDPRTFARDLPESAGIHTALLRALHKDPNQRFVSCSAFATALGCQLQSTVTPSAPILAEANVRTLRHFRLEIGSQSRQRLVLVPDAVWTDHDGEIKCWPIQNISKLEVRGGRGGVTAEVEINEWPFRETRIIEMPKGKSLQFAVSGASGRQRMRFSSNEDCKQWYDRISALKEVAQSKPVNEATVARPNPVALLHQRPNLRVQLLGPVEAEDKSRWAREGALRIRAALLQADAVIGVEEERIPGFSRTVRRISGIAVRAIDPAARAELRARWFDEQVIRLTRLMFWLLGVSFVLRTAPVLLHVLGLHTDNMLAEARGGNPGPSLAPMFWMSVALVVGFHLWPLLLGLLIRLLRCPQLLPAAALTFMVHQALPWFNPIGVIVSGLARHNSTKTAEALTPWLLGIEGWGLVIFGFLLAKRISHAYRLFRLAATETEKNVPPVRIRTGHAALAVSVVVIVLTALVFAGAGISEGASRAKTVETRPVSAPLVASTWHQPMTINLLDIGVSWVLNSGWHEELGLAQTGSLHTVKSMQGITATVEVQDTQALPATDRVDDATLLQRTEDRFFRFFIGPGRLTEPHAVQIDGVSWFEMQVKGTFSNTPNAASRLVLRAHSDPVRQITVMVGCPSPRWNQLENGVIAAADGVHFMPVSPARLLTGPPKGTRQNTWQGTRQTYYCRLTPVWQRTQDQDPYDLLFGGRGTTLSFSIRLEDHSKLSVHRIPSTGQAESEVLRDLNRKLPLFRLLASEWVEAGGRRGRLLRFTYRINQVDLTEFRLLAVDSGWLYDVRAISTEADPNLRELEEALAGIEFPSDSPR